VQAYELQCRLEGVPFGDLRTHVSTFKQRVYRRAATVLISRLVVDDVPLVRQNQADVADLKADALRYVQEQVTRPSAHQTACDADGDDVPLMHLLDSTSSTFEAYKARVVSWGAPVSLAV
jgi:hypothetical protein